MNYILSIKRVFPTQNMSVRKNNYIYNVNQQRTKNKRKQKHIKI